MKYRHKTETKNKKPTATTKQHTHTLPTNPPTLGDTFLGVVLEVRAHRPGEVERWRGDLLQHFTKEVLWVDKPLQILYRKRVLRTKKFEKCYLFYSLDIPPAC